MTCRFDNAFQGVCIVYSTHMVPAGSSDSTPTVELYVRTLAPRAARDRLERVVARLEALESADTVGKFSVRVTGKAIPATPAETVTDYGAFLCNRVAVFKEWARRGGHSIDARFERRSVHSQFTGEDYDAIVWPDLVLAEYVDGDLRFVAPCEADDETVTIEDRLQALEAAEPVEEPDRLSHARAEAPEEFTPAGQ